MKPLSLYVIGAGGFQPKCAPIFLGGMTAVQAVRDRTAQVQAWGWDSLSHGKLWSDMADSLTSRVVLDKAGCSLLCCHSTSILPPMISMPENLRSIPRQSGPWPIDPSLLCPGHVALGGERQRGRTIGSLVTCAENDAVSLQDILSSRPSLLERFSRACP